MLTDTDTAANRTSNNYYLPTSKRVTSIMHVQYTIDILVRGARHIRNNAASKTDSIFIRVFVRQTTGKKAMV